MATAGDLLEGRLCTPQCLLALGEEMNRCTCRCRGRWHGELVQAEVSGGIDTAPWHGRYANFPPGALDAVCPVVPDGVKVFNRLYQQARRERRVFAAVQKAGQRYRLTVDMETQSYPSRLSEDSAALWRALVVALIRAGRLQGGSAGTSLLIAYGIKTEREAQVLGAVAVDLHGGNVERVGQCLSALDEDGFVEAADRTAA